MDWVNDESSSRVSTVKFLARSISLMKSFGYILFLDIVAADIQPTQ